jgi:hypothetical protein
LTKCDAYRILSNRVYLGDVVHKGTAHPGEHDAIITQRQWDAVHAILQISPRVRVNRTRNTTAALLAEQEQWHAIVAADVFVYFGALEATLAAIARRLAPDGWLVFTTENILGTRRKCVELI